MLAAHPWDVNEDHRSHFFWSFFIVASKRKLIYVGLGCFRVILKGLDNKASTTVLYEVFGDTQS